MNQIPNGGTGACLTTAVAQDTLASIKQVENKLIRL